MDEPPGTSTQSNDSGDSSQGILGESMSGLSIQNGHSTSSSPPMADSILSALKLPPLVDQTTVKEFLIHLYGFLKNTGLENVAEHLKTELDSRGYIPPRYDLEGRPQRQTFDKFLTETNPFGTDLLQLLSRLSELSNSAVPPPISGCNARLFTSKATSLIRRRQLAIQSSSWSRFNVNRPTLNVLERCPKVNVLAARELGVHLSRRLLQRKSEFGDLNLQGRFQGHLASVFCVCFDQTGRYILTGSDDKLIKVWDTSTGLLRHTFRGNDGELVELSVNMENTLVASGCNDKSVRVWRLKDGRSMAVFKKHGAQITFARFIPYASGDTRYLVSAGNDCMVAFYKYRASTLAFENEPTRFEERAYPGARMLSGSFSAGGNFVVMGDSAQYVHIYQVGEVVHRIQEFPAHNDRIDSLVWAHSNLRFVSGSKDATAKVWLYKSGAWQQVPLKIHDSLNALVPTAAPTAAAANVQPSSRGGASYRVTMLGWTGDDSMVISTGSDFAVHLWDWETGNTIRRLDGHERDIYVISPHRTHVDLLFTAGHDGFIFLWDTKEGKVVWKHVNHEENTPAQLAIPISDAAISPDGGRIAFVDYGGQLTVYGVGENSAWKDKPRQQFFNTDYSIALIDRHNPFQNEDEDEFIGVPRQMVNADGVPYEENIQRMLPNYEDLFYDEQEDSKPRWCIVPPLAENVLEAKMKELALLSDKELEQFKKGEKVDGNVTEEQRQMVQQQNIAINRIERAQRRRQQRQNRRNTRLEAAAQLQAIAAAQPRYILDDNYTDNDSSYSEGNRSHHSGEESSTLDEDSEDEVAEDEYDSDYNVGRPEHATVHRNRSTHRRRQNRRSSNSRHTPTPPPVTQPQPTRYGRQPRPPVRMTDTLDASPTRRRSAAPKPRTRRTRAVIDSSDAGNSRDSAPSPQPGPSGLHETMESGAEENSRSPPAGPSTSSNNSRLRRVKVKAERFSPDAVEPHSTEPPVHHYEMRRRTAITPTTSTSSAERQTRRARRPPVRYGGSASLRSSSATVNNTDDDEFHVEEVVEEEEEEEEEELEPEPADDDDFIADEELPRRPSRRAAAPQQPTRRVKIEREDEYEEQYRPELHSTRSGRLASRRSMNANIEEPEYALENSEPIPAPTRNNDHPIRNTRRAAVAARSALIETADLNEMDDFPQDTDTSHFVRRSSRSTKRRSALSPPSSQRPKRNCARNTNYQELSGEYADYEVF